MDDHREMDVGDDGAGDDEPTRPPEETTVVAKDAVYPHNGGPNAEERARAGGQVCPCCDHVHRPDLVADRCANCGTSLGTEFVVTDAGVSLVRRRRRVRDVVAVVLGLVGGFVLTEFVHWAMS